MDTLSVSTRIKKLKAMTFDTHEKLDKRIMACDPFGNRQRYGLFLTVQRQFMADVDPHYRNAELNMLLPGLSERSRFTAIERDIIDILGNSVPIEPAPADKVSLGNSLGWLYVAEGSNLGAAFLLKEALKLGLDETFGARHLAGHAEGRGLHWRRFTAAFDSLELSEQDEADVAEGARTAFLRVHDLVGKAFS